MILTEEIAERNVGKYIDLYKRRFGYYPKQIIKLKDGSGRLAVKDTVGVCTRVSSNGIEEQEYDYIFEMLEMDEQCN